LRKEIKTARHFIHGDSCKGKRSRLYIIWTDIKLRCLYPKHKSYKNYGGKGIKICDEWKNNYVAFKSWALANGYQQNLTIDRIDNDESYCPKNCRWLTLSENSRNRGLKRWRKKQC